LQTYKLPETVKFRQNWSKYLITHYVLVPTNCSFWNGNGCQRSIRNVLLWPLSRNNSAIDCIHSFVQHYSARLMSHVDEIGSLDFDISDQLLIRYFAYIGYWRKGGCTVGECISCLQTLWCS
jgi:hypothetical protein